ncbi:MAG TPA: flagellar export chaperone FliS [Candidatus Acidoferrales bacterium]|nr:flagellar export chaperone FliS [Candidatus Acidoferrales bacterium]
MWNNGHDAYLESRILAADPVELVTLLYQACRQAVRDAREHLAAGRIGDRSRAITRAHEVLTELSGSLDHERGGEISRRLAELYDYMQRRLLDANMRQNDEPLVEVLGLLNTLAEAWESVKPAAKPALPAESPWAQPRASLETGAVHAWSF